MYFEKIKVAVEKFININYKKNLSTNVNSNNQSGGIIANKINLNIVENSKSIVTKEQKKILNLINNTTTNDLNTQLTQLSDELKLSINQLGNKLKHLCNDGFIINSRYFSNEDKIGFNIGCDGFVSIFGDKIILTRLGMSILSN